MVIDPTDATVGELMTDDPVVVWSDTPMVDVADLLERFDIGAVPVVDWSGYLVGIITQLDLIRVRSSATMWAHWPELAARNVMTGSPLAVSAAMPLDEAVQLMETHRVHRLVVVDDDGETPIGVLSATDIVRAMAGRTDR
jgi:CBS domain-containing protein